MTYLFEHTDTFGGDANYCWVNRTNWTPSKKDSRLSLVRALKAFAGFTGLRCDISDYGDTLEIRPRGLCQIAFAVWSDTP